MRLFSIGCALVAAGLVLGVASCERGASNPARSRDAAGAAASSSSSRDDGGGREGGGASGGYGRDGGGGGDGGGRDYGDRGERRAAREAVPDFHGEPMWSDNRRHTAQENAQYHCDKSGPDIGAKSLDECLTKVHAFIDHPPAGAETLTRANGDKLIYDPKANLFAVARKDGAPRTFFKPRTGADYWKQQQEEAKNGGGYRRRGYGGGDSRGDADAG